MSSSQGCHWNPTDDKNTRLCSERKAVMNVTSSQGSKCRSSGSKRRATRADASRHVKRPSLSAQAQINTLGTQGYVVRKSPPVKMRM